MELSKKIDLLKHTMDRYDHYYDSINNKSNLYLTLNTFLFGGIIAGYYSIKDEYFCSSSIISLVWIALIFCIISIGFVLIAITPYVSRHQKASTISVLNYSCIGSISLDDLKTAYDAMGESESFNDYLKQVHLLGKGLKKKFYYLRIATFFLGGVFLFITIIGIQIF